MNKGKFEIKCNNLMSYENEMLEKAITLLKDKNEKLHKLGLKCHTCLFWNYFGEDTINFTRIKFKENYTCQLYIVICKESDDPYDINLEAIGLIYTITALRKGLFIPIYKFEKNSIDGFDKTFNNLYKKVFEIGYDAALNAHKQKYR